MGFLTRLVEDVLDAGETIVRSPTRAICAVIAHDWRRDRYGERVCSLCGKRDRGTR